MADSGFGFGFGGWGLVGHPRSAGFHPSVTKAGLDENSWSFLKDCGGLERPSARR
jgi:hypothetical protein